MEKCNGAFELFSVYEGGEDLPDLNNDDDGTSRHMVLDLSDESIDLDPTPPFKRARLDHYCATCNSSFTERRALVRHYKTQQHLKKLGIGPSDGYACMVCGQIFTRDFDRRRHEKRRHAGTSVELTQEPELPPLLFDGSSRSSSDQSEPAEQGVPEQEILCHSNTGLRTAQPNVTSPILDNLVTALASPKPKLAASTDTEVSSFENFCISAFSLSTTSSNPEFSVSDPEANSGYHALSEPSINSAPVLSRKSAILRHGSVHIYATDAPQWCSMCEESFQTDDRALLKHLRMHLDQFYERNVENRCDLCEVSFTHKSDLQRHQQCASDGKCGFGFHHLEPCTGHHPPQRSSGQSDWDAFRYCIALRNWEQAQLQTYSASVNDLMATRATQDADMYSLEVCRRTSRDTLLSLPSTVGTSASAPCDQGADGKRDTRGLQQRLRAMSLRNPSRRARAEVPPANRVEVSCGPSEALPAAVQAGDLAKVKVLLKLGADPLIRSKECGEQNLPGEPCVTSALSLAITLENTKLLGLFLEHGAGVDQHVSSQASSLLTYAAGARKVKSLRLLLESRVKGDEADGGLSGPVSAAIRYNNLEGLEILVEHGAVLNSSAGCWGCPLGEAVAFGNLIVAQKLLQLGANIDQPGGFWGCPLSIAAGFGKEEAVRFLLEHGADANQQGGEYGNPLCSATGTCIVDDYREIRLHICAMLIGHRADPNACGPKGFAVDLAGRYRRAWLEGGTLRLREPATLYYGDRVVLCLREAQAGFCSFDR